jgi:sporulation protein YlmC with PRC-barrel domain
MATVQASELLRKNLYGADGREIGDIERVVMAGDNQSYLVVGAGGFLGLGERNILVSTNDVHLQGDRVIANRHLTQQEVGQMPEWRRNSTGYRELTGAQQVQIIRQ